MGKALAVTFIVSGIIAFTWAVLMWHKFSGGKGRNWIILMMVLSGVGVGTGAGALSKVGILTLKAGDFPVWLILVLTIGFAFVLEFFRHKDHRTRTPILGGITAVVLALAIGNGLALDATHSLHQVQVDSATHGGR